MINAIDELLSGKTCCLNRMADNEYYNKIQRDVEKLYDSLLKALADEQAVMVEELYNLMIEMEGETCAFHYKEGFKYGISLVVEALNEGCD